MSQASLPPALLRHLGQWLQAWADFLRAQAEQIEALTNDQPLDALLVEPTAQASEADAVAHRVSRPETPRFPLGQAGRTPPAHWLALLQAHGLTWDAQDGITSDEADGAEPATGQDVVRAIDEPTTPWTLQEALPWLNQAPLVNWLTQIQQGVTALLAASASAETDGDAVDAAAILAAYAPGLTPITHHRAPRVEAAQPLQLPPPEEEASLSSITPRSEPMAPTTQRRPTASSLPAHLPAPTGEELPTAANILALIAPIIAASASPPPTRAASPLTAQRPLVQAPGNSPERPLDDSPLVVEQPSSGQTELFGTRPPGVQPVVAPTQANAPVNPGQAAPFPQPIQLPARPVTRLRLSPAMSSLPTMTTKGQEAESDLAVPLRQEQASAVPTAQGRDEPGSASQPTRTTRLVMRPASPPPAPVLVVASPVAPPEVEAAPPAPVQAVADAGPIGRRFTPRIQPTDASSLPVIMGPPASAPTPTPYSAPPPPPTEPRAVEANSQLAHIEALLVQLIAQQNQPGAAGLARGRIFAPPTPFSAPEPGSVEHWPELPEPTTLPMRQPANRVRQQARRQRLDQEQRGRLWNV
jgi:hypothetical protein